MYPFSAQHIPDRKRNMHVPAVKQKYGKQWTKQAEHHWGMTDMELRIAVLGKSPKRRVIKCNQVHTVKYNGQRKTVINSRKRRLSSGVSDGELSDAEYLDDQVSPNPRVKRKVDISNQKIRTSLRLFNKNKHRGLIQEMESKQAVEDGIIESNSDRCDGNKEATNIVMTDIAMVLQQLPNMYR